MGGVHIPWKHSQEDEKASRVNVLGPTERTPDQGHSEIVIPIGVLFGVGQERDPDEGRFYWAYYHGPGGDWWYTEKPSDRSDDLTIERLRFGALGWRKRKLDRAVKAGENLLNKAFAELVAGAVLEGDDNAPS